ncbi:MAG: FecR domain-containing protein [Bacteroidota bacterium]
MNDAADKPIDPNLITRFLSGDATTQEREQLEEWIQASEGNKAHFEQLSLLWATSAAMNQADEIDIKKDWQQLKATINFKQARKESKVQPKQRNLLYQWTKIAAILIVALGIGWLAYMLIPSAGSNEMMVVSAGTQASPVTLPDGTKVFLNKNAVLTYPKEFSEHSREVQLKGEAFFEVVKNPHQPFLITSGHTTTRVLGTSFNVNAHRAQVVVTVVTGKVALYESAHPGRQITMLAGEQGHYQRGQLSKASHPNPNFLSWKTGVLIFKNTPLLQVVRDLNQHYQQHLRLDNPALEAYTLTSTFNQQTFNQVLEELPLVLPVSVTRHGKALLITGEGCSSSQ